MHLVARFISDFLFAIAQFRDSVTFIRKHRLWQGVFQYRWAAIIMMVVGILVSLKVFAIIKNSIFVASNPEMEQMAILGFFQNMWQEGRNVFVLGAYKYVILILFEIVIYHFIRQTISILSNSDEEPNWKSFVKALKRMIKVAIYNYMMEIIATIIIGIVLSVLGFSWLKALSVLLIQFYFLGFTLIDNYHEIHNLSIKESEIRTRSFAGAAMGLGLATYILLTIPLIGTILAPLMGGVAATMTMHKLEGPVIENVKSD